MASPMAEFNNIVTEYQDSNKLSTAYKMTPGYQKIDLPQEKGKVGSSTNHKNDELFKNAEDEGQARISKFILPGDLQDEEDFSTGNDFKNKHKQEYKDCLMKPQMSLGFLKKQDSFKGNNGSNRNHQKLLNKEQNIHESFIHEYIEKQSGKNQASFENQRHNKIYEVCSPKKESPRFSEIMKIMSSESKFRAKQQIFSESDEQSQKSKQKSSGKSRRTGKKLKSKEKQILQSLGVSSDKNVTDPSNESLKSQELRSPNDKSYKLVLQSQDSVVNSGIAPQAFSPEQSFVSKTSKQSKSKRKKKRKSKIFDECNDDGYEFFENTSITYEANRENSMNEQPEILEQQKKKSALKKSKKNSEKKIQKPPILYPSPPGNKYLNKNVQIEIQKQSKILENIIMSPLNRGSNSHFSGRFSERKQHGKVPTVENLLKNSVEKKSCQQLSFLVIQPENSHPGTARAKNGNQIPNQEDNFAKLMSPPKQRQNKQQKNKMPNQKQTHNKRSNIPTDLAVFSPNNSNQQTIHQNEKPKEYNLMLFKSMSEVQQKAVNVQQPEIIKNDKSQKKNGSQIQCQKQASKIRKPQGSQKLDANSLLQNDNPNGQIDMKKMLSSSQKFSDNGRVHSRKGSTIAEYIERTNKNIQQMAPPHLIQQAHVQPLFTKHKNNNSLFELSRASSKARNRQNIMSNLIQSQSLTIQDQVQVASKPKLGSNSLNNMNFVPQKGSASKDQKGRLPIAQTLSRQKQAQSCVEFEQFKYQSKNDFGNSLNKMRQMETDPSNNGIKSTANLSIGESTVQSIYLQTSGIANRLIDCHEEIGGNTQESSQQRSKNSSEEKMPSLQLLKEKTIVLDPGLEHILEQEDDVQEPLDNLVSQQEKQTKNISLQDRDYEQKPDVPISYHLASNDTEIMELRRDMLGETEAEELIQNMYSLPTDHCERQSSIGANGQSFVYDKPINSSEVSNPSSKRAKQTTQNMQNPKIIQNEVFKQIETPIRKPETEFKSIKNLSASQKLLADRRSRDRQKIKTDTRKIAGGLYQVRKMKSDINGFLINQMSEPIETTTLRKKKPETQKIIESSLIGPDTFHERARPLTNLDFQPVSNIVVQERPIFEKKQSLPARNNSQKNIKVQKKQLNSNSQNTLIIKNRNKKQSVQYQNSIMQTLKNQLTAVSNENSKDNHITQLKKQILASSDSGAQIQPVLKQASARNNLACVYNCSQPQTNKFTRVNENRNSNKNKVISKYVTQNSGKRNANISSVRTPVAQGQQQKTPITQKIGGNLAAPKSQVTQKQSATNSLLQSEKEKYGDRCPAGYKKLGLLGKGGIALVWLAEVNDYKKCGLSESMVGQKVALKQFPKVRGQHTIDGSAKIEIETGNTLFPMRVKDECSGDLDSDFERSYAIDPEIYPGIKSISRLLDQCDEKNDFWLVYEVGSQCLGKYLCEVKGEFYKGERIYNCSHQQFYEALSRNPKILATFIRKVAEVFEVLSRFGIVHSDIKPDNILVQFSPNGCDIESIKLIDFGSAFQFHNVTQITATTPEYLAPEILQYLEERNKNSKSNISSALLLRDHSQPWSFDVWSLGVILLEIVTGFPVWMSLKCRVSTVDHRSVLGQGIFGVQGREGKKIIVKQQQACKNLKQTLKRYECYGLDQDLYFMDLLEKMLDFNPTRRISPLDIVDHPFCKN